MWCFTKDSAANKQTKTETGLRSKTSHGTRLKSTTLGNSVSSHSVTKWSKSVTVTILSYFFVIFHK